MISMAFSIVNMQSGDIRKAKEVLKIVDELVNAAATFRSESQRRECRPLICQVESISTAATDRATLAEPCMRPPSACTCGTALATDATGCGAVTWISRCFRATYNVE
jgi:hypothetical protein